MKVLIIEDDTEVCELIRANLTRDGITAEDVMDGNAGSFKARTENFDIIILDYSLPSKTGIQVCEEIRDAGVNTPIIFLTIHNEVKKKISALDKGADDYVIKPFSYEELKSRMFAILRRPRKIESQVLRAGDLTLDTRKKVVCRGRKQIYLTKKTYNLLEFLLKNKGTVLSRGAIMEHVWNTDSDPFSNTVESHVRNLRRRINIQGKKEILRNVPGRGYVID